MRIGGKKKPFYRVVVVEERSKRTGGYVELLGTYNPLTEPKEIKLKQDRINYWIRKGAQMSVGYLRIIGKAKQRPPRKPRKESKQGTGDSGQVKTESATKQEKPTKNEGDEVKSETAETPSDVIASEAKQSPTEEITMSPSAPRDDEVNIPTEEVVKEEEKKDEGSA